MLFVLYVSFVALLLFDGGDFHVTFCGFDGEVDAIVDGDAVQEARVGYWKFHLHGRHQALDVSVVDLDCGSFEIDALHDPNALIRV